MRPGEGDGEAAIGSLRRECGLLRGGEVGNGRWNNEGQVCYFIINEMTETALSLVYTGLGNWEIVEKRSALTCCFVGCGRVGVFLSFYFVSS